MKSLIFVFLSFIFCLSSLAEDDVYLIFLRQPKAKISKGIETLDMRTDPFWEFGSFGLTGCHSKNLLHPNNIAKLKGNYVAFLQANIKDGEAKLVNLVKVIDYKCHQNVCEINWDPQYKPFKFEYAPVFINNSGDVIHHKVLSMIAEVNRGTNLGKIGSKFRTRTERLPKVLSNTIIKTFESLREQSSVKEYIDFYYEAISKMPPVIDSDRKGTYRKLLEKANCSGNITPISKKTVSVLNNAD